LNYALSWHLRRHGGEYHLPDDLAAALSLPAARVSRELDELARNGFQLERHPTAGVRLLAGPPALDRDELSFARAGKRVGHTVRVYDETSSTNDVALRLAEAGSKTEGLVVVAESQTAGRGRLGASWFGSRAQSLLFSIVHWRPATPGSAGELMLAAAVAVAEAMEHEASVRVGIKWPNDIEIARRKVAGILVECPGRAARSKDAARPAAPVAAPYVLGIGVNVNQSQDSFPPEIADQAGSLHLATGRLHDRTVLLERILDVLEGALDLLERGGQDELLARYMAHCEMVGREVVVKEGRRTFSGRVESILPHFALVLRLDDGSHRSFDAASVRLT